MIGKLKLFGGKGPGTFDKTSELNAFLGSGTEFDGKLSFIGTVRVEGSLKGEIFAKDILIIGDNGRVEGDIDVDTIIISGLVRGTIRAAKRVELAYPGRVYGTIETPIFTIQEGAIFEGTCKMDDIKENLERDKFSASMGEKDHKLVKVSDKKGGNGRSRI